MRKKTKTGVRIETLYNPTWYTPHQIDLAAAVAAFMDRGKLFLVELPPRKHQ